MGNSEPLRFIDTDGHIIATFAAEKMEAKTTGHSNVAPPFLHRQHKRQMQRTLPDLRDLQPCVLNVSISTGARLFRFTSQKDEVGKQANVRTNKKEPG